MARIVYSSGKGRICPGCGHPVDSCCCAGTTTAPAGDGIVRVRRETRGRKGKTVTVVTGLAVQGNELKQLASRLKRRCGSGGTSRGGTVEIQGDHVALVSGELERLGYEVGKSG